MLLTAMTEHPAVLGVYPMSVALVHARHDRKLRCIKGFDYFANLSE